MTIPTICQADLVHKQVWYLRFYLRHRSSINSRFKLRRTLHYLLKQSKHTNLIRKRVRKLFRGLRCRIGGHLTDRLSHTIHITFTRRVVVDTTGVILWQNRWIKPPNTPADVILRPRKIDCCVNGPRSTCSTCMSLLAASVVLYAQIKHELSIYCRVRRPATHNVHPPTCAIWLNRCIRPTDRGMIGWTTKYAQNSWLFAPRADNGTNSWMLGPHPLSLPLFGEVLHRSKAWNPFSPRPIAVYDWWTPKGFHGDWRTVGIPIIVSSRQRPQYLFVVSLYYETLVWTFSRIFNLGV
jgi:hypothetical protein